MKLLLALCIIGAAALGYYLYPKSGLLIAGVFGALIANSTGAGGGVVFIPLFQALQLAPNQSVATSFAIQWFGMTTGALSWCYAYATQWKFDSAWVSFVKLVAICSLASVWGVWTNYGFNLVRPIDLGILFSIFSIFFGLCVLFTLLMGDTTKPREQPSKLDLFYLSLFSYLGGIFTAWVSVGVGEFIAIWLILRRFNPAFSIAVAVVVSAITVWSAMPQHLTINPQISWVHAWLIIPGAIIGALLARHLVQYLGTRRLKLYFAVCLLLIGLEGL